MNELIFLKLGGSLITEKSRVATPRPQILTRLANEIAAARTAQPGLHLLLGHGSGSFGHVPANKYKTKDGVRTEAQWAGFIEVWQQAAALNHLVMKALEAAELPVISFPPSAMVTVKDGQIKSWNTAPIQMALQAKLLPMIHGDVALDSARGGTILSTEDLFVYLAGHLHPSKILLAGDEDGIYEDYPARKKLVAEITPKSFSKLSASVSGSVVTDVTGGMLGKVQTMLETVEQMPACEVRIFSGMEPGALQSALGGQPLGTWLHAD